VHVPPFDAVAALLAQAVSYRYANTANLKKKLAELFATPTFQVVWREVLTGCRTNHVQGHCQNYFRGVSHAAPYLYRWQHVAGR
jgi:hypothetical protein